MKNRSPRAVIGKWLFVFCAVGLAYSVPATDWDFTLGPVSVIPNTTNVPIYPWYPDGHISVLKEDDGRYTMYWPEFETYRSVADSPFPEHHTTLVPSHYVIGGRYEVIYPTNTFGSYETRFDNGGLWLMSVLRLSGDNLLGIYHAEYHSERWAAPWKSIAVCYSYTNGVSWEIDRPNNLILTSNTPAPYPSDHGGVGDCCVVWDHVNERWACYYQEGLLQLAVSYDPLAAPGTWYKWHNDTFTQPGLGGLSTALPGLSSKPGANCSMHWNTYLDKWVIVWHGWSPASCYISTSVDGIHWEEPRLLIDAASGMAGQTWYPNIIGETDLLAGRTARVYYGDFTGEGGIRLCKGMDITFTRPDPPPVAAESQSRDLSPSVANPLKGAALRLDRDGICSLTLPKELRSAALVKVFTMQGRLAAVQRLQAGATEIVFRSTSRPGGAYILQMGYTGKTFHNRYVLTAP